MVCSRSAMHSHGLTISESPAIPSIVQEFHPSVKGAMLVVVEGNHGRVSLEA